MRRRKRRSRSRIRIKKEPKAVRRRVVRKCRRTVGISIWLRTVGIRIRFITVAISIRFITVSTLSFFLDLLHEAAKRLQAR